MTNSVHMDINNRHRIDYTDRASLDQAIVEGLDLCHSLKNDASVTDDDYNVLANNVQYYMYKRALADLLERNKTTVVVEDED